MWYAANLLFKGSRSSAAGGEPLWEESIRLISADSAKEARVKAERLGRTEKVSYAVKGGAVSWAFDRVERIHAIDADALSDGTELFSRFLRDAEVVSLLTPFEES
jgi:hypothetical protein